MNQPTASAPSPEHRSLRPFFVLWSGQAVSLFGSQIVQFALIWWLTQKTGSGTVLAMASLVGLLPQVLLGPFVGVLVDRWNRRLLLIVADSSIALASLGLAYLFWLEAAEIWHIFALLFVRALGGAFHWPAMQASISLMVPNAFLTRVQGMNQMLNGGLGIVSAPLGALLVETLTMPALLGIDVATAVVAILPLFFIAIPQPPAAKPENGETEAPSFWAEMKIGIRYILSWPALMALIGIAMLLNFLFVPLGSLEPLLVTQHFQGSAIHLSWLQAGLGVGVIVGGLLLSSWGGFEKKVYTLLCGLFGLGVGVLLLGVAPQSMFWLAVTGSFLLGLMSAFANGPLFAILQATTDSSMQGRVFTLLNSSVSAISPLSLILAGPFSDAFGVRPWFVIGGIVAMLLAVSGFFNRTLLTIEDGRATTSALTDFEEGQLKA